MLQYNIHLYVRTIKHNHTNRLCNLGIIFESDHSFTKHIANFSQIAYPHNYSLYLFPRSVPPLKLTCPLPRFLLHTQLVLVTSMLLGQVYIYHPMACNWSGEVAPLLPLGFQNAVKP